MCVNLIKLVLILFFACLIVSTYETEVDSQLEYRGFAALSQTTNRTILPVDALVTWLQLRRAVDKLRQVHRRGKESDLTLHTSACFRDLTFILESLRHLNKSVKADLWILQMVDSVGKLPSGVLEGNIYWTGDYHECLHLKVPKDRFKGRYCQARFSMSDEGNNTGMQYSAPGGLMLGLCVPDSCSADDLLYARKILADIIELIPQLKNLMKDAPPMSSLSCDVARPLDATAIVAIVVMLLVLFLVLLGTAADVYLENQIVLDGYKSLTEETPGSLNLSSNRVILSTNDDVIVSADTQPENETLAKIHEYVRCFSLRSNAQKLFSTGGKGDLKCIHGIRFLSMLWIITGHMYVFLAAINGNILRILEDIDNFPFYTILNGTFSVDTFFVLSGFLVGYLFLVETGRGLKFSLWKFYLWRYWRLTPAYAMILWFDVSLSRYFGSGPFWDYGDADTSEHAKCSKYWWTNLLYINNWNRDYTVCMAWTWYLANDMQFHILSPLFLLAFLRRPRLGIVLSAGALAISWITTGILSYSIGFTGLPKSGNDITFNATSFDLDKLSDYFDKIYVKPYCRIQPYILGLVTAYILYSYAADVKTMRTWRRLLGTFLAATSSLFALYITYHADLTNLEESLYTAFSRTFWAVGVCWMILHCLSGNLRLVNSILSWSFWAPLSRATYCAYLVHPILMMIFFNNFETPLMFSHMKILFLIPGMTVCVYIAAILLSLVIEAPLIHVGKVLFSPRRQET